MPNDIEKLVMKTVEALNAKGESSARDLNSIAMGCNRPRGLVSNAVASLVSKKVLNRISKDKRSLYYIQSKR
ncbi:MAG: hypothetical protein M1562_01460 [Candidatus Marsarchaeota archaeon]|jgi:hypothetical protein|nr:hypothetical protein [Candidatus Marsarchaeota archaeon]